jgi:hypothetical protein
MCIRIRLFHGGALENMYAIMYVCMYAVMYVCMYAVMYVCMYAVMYVCTRVQNLVEFLEGRFVFDACE